MNSDLLIVFNEMKNFKNLKLTINQYESIDKFYEDIEIVPSTTAAMIKKNMKLFKDIAASADPFGVVDTINYINDKTNELIIETVDNVDQNVNMIQEAATQISKATLELTKIGYRLTAQLNMIEKAIETAEQTIEDLKFTIKELNTQILNVVKNAGDVTNDMFSSIKKILPILLCMVIIIIAIIIVKKFSNNNRSSNV